MTADLSPNHLSYARDFDKTNKQTAELPLQQCIRTKHKRTDLVANGHRYQKKGALMDDVVV